MNVTFALLVKRQLASLDFLPMVAAERTTLITLNYGINKATVEVDTKELVSLLEAIKLYDASLANSAGKGGN